MGVSYSQPGDARSYLTRILLFVVFTAAHHTPYSTLPPSLLLTLQNTIPSKILGTAQVSMCMSCVLQLLRLFSRHEKKGPATLDAPIRSAGDTLGAQNTQHTPPFLKQVFYFIPGGGRGDGRSARINSRVIMANGATSSKYTAVSMHANMNIYGEHQPPKYQTVSTDRIPGTVRCSLRRPGNKKLT